MFKRIKQGDPCRQSTMVRRVDRGTMQALCPRDPSEGCPSATREARAFTHTYLFITRLLAPLALSHSSGARRRPMRRTETEEPGEPELDT